MKCSAQSPLVKWLVCGNYNGLLAFLLCPAHYIVHYSEASIGENYFLHNKYSCRLFRFVMGEEDRGGVRLEGNNEHFFVIHWGHQSLVTRGPINRDTRLSQWPEQCTMSEYIYWVFNTIMPHSKDYSSGNTWEVCNYISNCITLSCLPNTLSWIRKINLGHAKCVFGLITLSSLTLSPSLCSLSRTDIICCNCCTLCQVMPLSTK